MINKRLLEIGNFDVVICKFLEILQFVFALDNSTYSRVLQILELKARRMVGSRGSGEGYLSLLGGVHGFAYWSIFDLHGGRDWNFKETSREHLESVSRA